jgi:hypothetical protein
MCVERRGMEKILEITLVSTLFGSVVFQPPLFSPLSHHPYPPFGNIKHEKSLFLFLKIVLTAAEMKEVQEIRTQI